MPALPSPTTAPAARPSAPSTTGPTAPALPAPRPIGNVRAALLILVGFAVVAVAMFLWWPAGVVLGLVMGVAVVLGLGGAQQHAAAAVSADDALGELQQLFGGSAAAAQPAVPAVERITPHAAPEPEAPSPAVAGRPLAQQAVADPAPVAVAAAPAAPPVRATRPPQPEPGVRADLGRLKAELGDDYPDFARAARLVVSTQYASAARLQRDLHLPYSRARRLLADLETEHFVGPATGTLPRQVLLPKEKLPEVERLFAGV